MKRVLDPAIKIKAAGGIHTYDEAMGFLNAGASIMGASAGIKIVEQERKIKNYNKGLWNYYYHISYRNFSDIFGCLLRSSS